METWDSAWNLKTLVLALRAFMTTHPTEIGGVHASSETRKRLALSSQSFRCDMCGAAHYSLLPTEGSVKINVNMNLDVDMDVRARAVTQDMSVAPTKDPDWRPTSSSSSSKSAKQKKPRKVRKKKKSASSSPPSFSSPSSESNVLFSLVPDTNTDAS